jgi:Calcium binding
VPKPRRSRIREERIHNEIIVDACGPEEQALGWYYYLENKFQFPFTARCVASKGVSPLRKGETIEVRGLAPEDYCAHDMLVLVRWYGRNVAAPLSQLTAIDADESTAEAIDDWHYWLAQGYCF